MVLNVCVTYPFALDPVVFKLHVSLYVKKEMNDVLADEVIEKHYFIMNTWIFHYEYMDHCLGGLPSQTCMEQCMKSISGCRLCIMRYRISSFRKGHSKK